MSEKSTSMRWRDGLWFAAKWLIGISLLAFALTRVDLMAVWLVIRNVDPGSVPWLLLTVVIFFTAHLISAQKLGGLLPGRTQFEMIRAVMIGHFFSIALPGQLAGDAAKAVTLMGAAHSRSQVLAAVILDKLTSLLALAFLVLLSVFLAPDLILGPNAALWSTAAFVLLLGVSALPSFCASVPGPDWLKAAHQAWRDYTRDAGLMSRQGVLSLVFQTLAIGVFVSLDAALGIGLDFAEWALVAGVVSIALLLPVSVAGLGVREVTFVTLLPLLGVPAEKALAVSLLVFFLLLMAAVLGAVLWFTRPYSAR